MSSKKVVLSVRVEPELLERLRNVVYFKRDITINDYVSNAVNKELNLETVPLEFERINKTLRTGKRVKSSVIIPEDD